MTVPTPGDSASAEQFVTESMIDSYAELVGDRNPIHIDDEYAGNTMFNGRIAHGMLTAGVISSALANLPGDIIYLAQDLQFEAPVRPNTTIHAEANVESVIDDERIIVETLATVDDKVVLSGTAKVLSLPHE